MVLICTRTCKVKVAQLCPTLGENSWNSPGQNTGVFWVAIPFSRGSSQPRDQTQVSCIAGGFLSAEPQGKPALLLNLKFSVKNLIHG